MKTVITLGRQLGSNGRIIGKALAEKLGYKFYDKELLARMAKDSRFSERFLEEMDEKPTSSLLYSLAVGVQSGHGIYYPHNEMLSNSNVFRAQAELIRTIASEGPCIIVGRCADYVLSEHPYLIKLFLHASPETRARNVMERDGLSEKEARSLISKADKRRASYYNFYTNNTWGHVNNYNLCLDTESFSKDACVDFLYSYVKEKEKEFGNQSF